MIHTWTGFVSISWQKSDWIRTLHITCSSTYISACITTHTCGKPYHITLFVLQSLAPEYNVYDVFLQCYVQKTHDWDKTCATLKLTKPTLDCRGKCCITCAMECLLYSVAILLDNIVHTYNAWVIISQIYMKRLWPLNSSAIQVLFVQSTKQACCYREGRSYIAYMTIVCPVDFTANTNAHNVRMYTCIWIYILMHITCKYRYESRSHKFAIFWIRHMYTATHMYIL